MASKLIEDNQQPIAEINIIPFVDIILVILIIFMMTVPYIMKSGLSLDLPKASSAGRIDNPKVNITIRTDGMVLLNGKAFNPQEIEKKLETGQLDPDKTQVVIFADQNVLHGKVISVINSIKVLGLKKVAIGARKKKK